MANEYRITHALVEVLRKGDPDARITHALAEVIREGDPDARITHALAEVIREGDPDCRLSHALIEVLRASSPLDISVATEYVALTESTTARLIGEVTKSGGGAVISCYFQYRLEGGSVWLESDIEILTGTDRFIIDISGLTENSTYEYRAVAHWVEGDGDHYEYGDTETFKAYFIWEKGVGFETGELYGVSADDTGLYI